MHPAWGVNKTWTADQAALPSICTEISPSVRPPRPSSRRTALRSSAHLVELSPGGLLLHRGDLPHADPCVRKVDVRLQGTLLVDDVVHESAVERVAWSFFRCNFCFKRCDSKRALANHERYCDSNPDKESIAKKHKANNDKGAFCEKYKHHFSNKNTFNVHKC
ncbi:hypothetical protein PF006_g19913 [Phytophthora fragariae]|uniref:Uncharacterized protein n=1 Tax=Phytophthora fragariae TaxID=53985 RepID=A0A6A3SAP9_9STRA|nr:hypothetical protein PF006_g19913 [Phytophthora fragariae]